MNQSAHPVKFRSSHLFSLLPLKHLIFAAILDLSLARFLLFLENDQAQRGKSPLWLNHLRSFFVPKFIVQITELLYLLRPPLPDYLNVFGLFLLNLVLNTLNQLLPDSIFVQLHNLLGFRSFGKHTLLL